MDTIMGVWAGLRLQMDQHGPSAGGASGGAEEALAGLQHIRYLRGLGDLVTRSEENRRAAGRGFSTLGKGGLTILRFAAATMLLLLLKQHLGLCLCFLLPLALFLPWARRLARRLWALWATRGPIP